MKTICLAILMLFVATAVHAQCVAEIKKVYEDPLDILKAPGDRRIIVETEYTLNGKVVDVDGSPCFEKDGKYYIALINPKTLVRYDKECIGRNRFLNTSGDDVSIIAQAKKGIDIHCENLIKRIDKNRDFVVAERQKRLVELTVGRTSRNIILNIKDSLIGLKSTKIEAVDTFKGKDIKVTYDSKNTITDTAIAIP